MLAATEFSVGAISTAGPLSLMLPRTRYETMCIIGVFESSTAAVTIDGNPAYYYFQTDRSTWLGMLIPNVRIEVDEASLFDPNSYRASAGTVERVGTRLVVHATTERSFSGTVKITLEDGLTDTGNQSAAFSKWQIVLGQGQDKRVLKVVDSGQDISTARQ